MISSGIYFEWIILQLMAGCFEVFGGILMLINSEDVIYFGPEGCLLCYISYKLWIEGMVMSILNVLNT